MSHVANVKSRSHDLYNAKSIQDVFKCLKDLRESKSLVGQRLNGFITEFSSWRLNDSLRSQANVFNGHDSVSVSSTLASGNLMQVNTLTADCTKIYTAIKRERDEARKVQKLLVDESAKSAQGLLARVRRLIKECDNVYTALEAVNRVIELKACIMGAYGCMETVHDWEAAANYIYRTRNIPFELIDSEFCQKMIPTANLPDKPSVSLKTAQNSLCDIFLEQFRTAAAKEDGIGVSRFFKLFPLIGCDERGIQAYSEYVSRGIVARARKNFSLVDNKLKDDNTFTRESVYVCLLSSLFEHVMNLINSHESLIEQYYGRDMIVYVIQRIQRDVDIQAGLLVENWFEYRDILRKSLELKSYSFPYLLKILKVPAPGNISVSTTSLGAKASGKMSTPLPDTMSGKKVLAGDAELIDLKIVDLIFNEMIIILGQWSIYTRFVSKRIDQPTSSLPSKGVNVPRFIQDSTFQDKIMVNIFEPFNQFISCLTRGTIEKAFYLEEIPVNLIRQINTFISTCNSRVNVMFTEDNNVSTRSSRSSFMHDSDLQSNEMNEHDEADLSMHMECLALKQVPLPSQPFISSIIDDIMYIIDKIVTKSLVTGQYKFFKNSIFNVSRILLSDFIATIQKRLSYERQSLQHPPFPDYRDPLSRSKTYSSSLHNSSSKSLFLNMRFTFLTPNHFDYILLINNLDATIVYMIRIFISSCDTTTVLPSPQVTLSQEIPLALQTLFPFNTADDMGEVLPKVHEGDDFSDAIVVYHDLVHFISTFSAKVSALIDESISVLFNIRVKPALRILLGHSTGLIFPERNQHHEPLQSESTGEHAWTSSQSSPCLNYVKQRFLPRLNALLLPVLRLMPPAVLTCLTSLSGHAARSLHLVSSSSSTLSPMPSYLPPAHRIILTTASYLAGYIEHRIWLMKDISSYETALLELKLDLFIRNLVSLASDTHQLDSTLHMPVNKSPIHDTLSACTNHYTDNKANSNMYSLTDYYFDIVYAMRLAIHAAFARCQQMLLILSMDSEEWNELESMSPSSLTDNVRSSCLPGAQKSWALDSNERRRVRALMPHTD